MENNVDIDLGNSIGNRGVTTIQSLPTKHKIIFSDFKLFVPLI